MMPFLPWILGGAGVGGVAWGAYSAGQKLATIAVMLLVLYLALKFAGVLK